MRDVGLTVGLRMGVGLRHFHYPEPWVARFRCFPPFVNASFILLSTPQIWVECWQIVLVKVGKVLWGYRGRE
jgi:hypothetical protein